MAPKKSKRKQLAGLAAAVAIGAITAYGLQRRIKHVREQEEADEARAEAIREAQRQQKPGWSIILNNGQQAKIVRFLQRVNTYKVDGLRMATDRGIAALARTYPAVDELMKDSRVVLFERLMEVFGWQLLTGWLIPFLIMLLEFVFSTIATWWNPQAVYAVYTLVALRVLVLVVIPAVEVVTKTVTSAHDAWTRGLLTKLREAARDPVGAATAMVPFFVALFLINRNLGHMVTFYDSTSGQVDISEYFAAARRDLARIGQPESRTDALSAVTHLTGLAMLPPVLSLISVNLAAIFVTSMSSE